MRSRLGDAPSVVKLSETDGGFVLHLRRVKSSANFVQRDPFPYEFDIGGASLLADAGDGDEFPFGGGNSKRWFVGCVGGQNRVNGVDSGWGEKDIPAWGWDQARRTRGRCGRDPPMMLEDEIFGRDVVFVRDDSSLQEVLLWSFEIGGGANQVGGETAGEKVARRAGGKEQQHNDRRRCNVSHVSQIPKFRCLAKAARHGHPAGLNDLRL